MKVIKKIDYISNDLASQMKNAKLKNFTNFHSIIIIFMFSHIQNFVCIIKNNQT